MSTISKSNCCGCYSLGTGTTIITILGLIGSFGGITIYFIAQGFVSTFPIAGKVILSASIINLVACILLIVSVIQQKSVLTIPWLVEALFLYLAGIIFSIFLLSFFFGFIIIWIILLTICGLHGYYWFVVFHFHRELNFAEEKRRTKAAESNENRMMSVVSCQNSLSGPNKAKTQGSKVVTCGSNQLEPVSNLGPA